MCLASSYFGSIPEFNGKCSLVIINDNEKQSIKLNAKFNYIIINKKHSKKTNGGAILKIKKKFLKKAFKTLTLFFFVTLVWSPRGALQTYKNGAPGKIRTCDKRLRRSLLYPLSYWSVKGNGSPARIRT